MGRTVYHGVLMFPLKCGNVDYSNANIDYSSVIGKNIDGLTINHVVKAHDCFEVSYTLTDPTLISKITTSSRVECSIGGILGLS